MRSHTYMFICSILIPIIMILSGRFMWKHPPKKINRIIGYRTPMSMKNPDTWKFAHEYCGRIWWKIGWILLLLSVVTIIIVQLISADASETAGAVFIIIQTIILVASIIPTETALRKTFTADGERKIH